MQPETRQQAEVPIERRFQRVDAISKQPGSRITHSKTFQHGLHFAEMLDDFRNRDDVFSDLRHDEGPRYSPNVVSRQTNQMW